MIVLAKMPLIKGRSAAGQDGDSSKYPRTLGVVG